MVKISKYAPKTELKPQKFIVKMELAIVRIGLKVG